MICDSVVTHPQNIDHVEVDGRMGCGNTQKIAAGGGPVGFSCRDQITFGVWKSMVAEVA